MNVFLSQDYEISWQINDFSVEYVDVFEKDPDRLPTEEIPYYKFDVLEWAGNAKDKYDIEALEALSQIKPGDLIEISNIDVEEREKMSIRVEPSIRVPVKKVTISVSGSKDWYYVDVELAKKIEVQGHELRKLTREDYDDERDDF